MQKPCEVRKTYMVCKSVKGKAPDFRESLFVATPSWKQDMRCWTTWVGNEDGEGSTTQVLWQAAEGPRAF